MGEIIKGGVRSPVYVKRWPREQWEKLAEKVVDAHGRRAQNPSQQERLKGILDKILAASYGRTAGYDYPITLIQNDEPTGWALPDGHIFLATGLLEVVQGRMNNSDDALAFAIC